MDNRLNKLKKTRQRRLFRVRKGLHGTSEKPRLSVSKTNRHIYAQLIDDEQGKTLLGVGTLSKNFRTKKSKSAAKTVGEQVAKLAKEKKIQQVIFDRGRFKYHGVIAELAKAARDGGLQF